MDSVAELQKQNGRCHTPGLGLRTMQYRASMIGAQFEIAPFGRKGARVLQILPAVRAKQSRDVSGFCGPPSATP
jgi:signal transduction histidine kinase